MLTLVNHIYDALPKKELIPIPKAQSPFIKSKSLQALYERALRNVARQVSKLIAGYEPKDVISADALRRALFSYAEILSPWALNLVRDIMGQANKQDKEAWKKHTRAMGLAMQKEIAEAPMGEVLRDLMRRNVQLIKSIPEQEGRRVHELVIANIAEGRRADEIAKKIRETNNVSLSRATLIARTEISRASTKLMQARAETVGSEGYVWQTSGDMIVRPSHRKMEKIFVRWDSPPVLDKMTGHAGEFPNCRCWPEPILNEYAEGEIG